MQHPALATMFAAAHGAQANLAAGGTATTIEPARFIQQARFQHIAIHQKKK